MKFKYIIEEINKKNYTIVIDKIDMDDRVRAVNIIDSMGIKFSSPDTKNTNYITLKNITEKQFKRLKKEFMDNKIRYRSGSL